MAALRGTPLPSRQVKSTEEDSAGSAASAPAGEDSAAAAAVTRRLSDEGCVCVCQSRMTNSNAKTPTAKPAQKGHNHGVRAAADHQRRTGRAGRMFCSLCSGKRGSGGPVGPDFNLVF